MQAANRIKLHWFLIGVVSMILAMGVFNLYQLVSFSSPVNLPKTDELSAVVPGEPITISVTSDGAIFIGNSETSLEQIASHLMEITKGDYQQRIYLRGPHDVSYNSVMEVMARVNGAGFSNLGLVTDSKTPDGKRN